MPIMNGNPLNGNPAAEEGDHEPAQRLRQTIYDSVKRNLDESSNELSQSVDRWSVDEDQLVDKILLALETAIDDIDAISTKIKVADEETHEVIDLVQQRSWGDEAVELRAAHQNLQAQRSRNVDFIIFLNRLKYETFLVLEHDINLHHNKADTKRVQFKAHIDAVNDVTEIMSGALVEMATKESFIRRNAAAARATITKCTQRYIQGMFLLNLVILVLVYFRIIPPFVIVQIARCVIRVFDEDM